jgi:hypothetical protein
MVNSAILVMMLPCHLTAVKLTLVDFTTSPLMIPASLIIDSVNQILRQIMKYHNTINSVHEKDYALYSCQRNELGRLRWTSILSLFSSVKTMEAI